MLQKNGNQKLAEKKQSHKKLTNSCLPGDYCDNKYERVFMIRYVNKQDKASWRELDRSLSGAGFAEKVRNKQGYVFIKDSRIIGVLRYNLFWDQIPFCTHLYIADECRGRGYGRLLMERWEKEMKKTGFDVIMTSTQVDEEGQHFYRKLGFKDCGGFTMDIPGHEQPMELIMVKAI